MCTYMYMYLPVFFLVLCTRSPSLLCTALTECDLCVTGPPYMIYNHYYRPSFNKQLHYKCMYMYIKQCTCTCFLPCVNHMTSDAREGTIIIGMVFVWNSSRLCVTCQYAYCCITKDSRYEHTCTCTVADLAMVPWNPPFWRTEWRYISKQIHLLTHWSELL